MEEKGIQQTKEVISGVIAIGALLYSKFQDGVQAKDFAEIFAKIQGDAELQAKLLAAYNEAHEVPAEVKDIKLAEGIELGAHALKELMAALELLKKA